jgi:hypothetical protein
MDHVDVENGTGGGLVHGNGDYLWQVHLEPDVVGRAYE